MKAEQITNRIFKIYGFGFVLLNDRKDGNEWSQSEKDFARSILNQIRRDSVSKILERWLVRGKISPCRVLQNMISQNTI